MNDSTIWSSSRNCTKAGKFIVLILFSKKLGGVKNTLLMPKLKLRIFRGLIISLSCFLSYVAFMNLEMTTAYALIFMAPILAKIVSVFLVKEPIKPISWILSAVGFLGVLIVLRPGSIPFNIGTISAIGLAICFAFGHTLARFIGKENQTFLSLAFFQYFFIALFSSIPAYFAFQHIQYIPPFDWLLLFGIGVFGVTGGVLVSTSFSQAPVAYIAPIHYCQIILGTLWGYLFFSELPDIYTVLGSIIIVSSGIALVYVSNRKDKKTRNIRIRSL